METKKELLNKLLKLEKENPTKCISSPEDAVPVFMKWAKKEKEHFIVMCLDAAHQIMCTESVSMGSLNSCIVSPREVFRKAIKKNACAIIVAHNHPSGSLNFSKEDINIENRLKECGKILGISILDSIIVSKNGFNSMVKRESII